MAGHGCGLKYGDQCLRVRRRDVRNDAETVQVGVLYRHSAPGSAGLLHLVAGCDACSHDSDDGGMDGRSIIGRSCHIRIVHERSDTPGSYSSERDCRFLVAVKTHPPSPFPV
jgi:hypothetical protein